MEGRRRLALVSLTFAWLAVVVLDLVLVRTPYLICRSPALAVAAVAMGFFVVGFILALAALRSPKKLLPISGMVINGLIILVVVVMVLAMERAGFRLEQMPPCPVTL